MSGKEREGETDTEKRERERERKIERAREVVTCEGICCRSKNIAVIYTQEWPWPLELFFE